MIITKNKTLKTTESILIDIRYGFNNIIAQNHPIYNITINNTGCKTKVELRFYLTNKLFNKIKNVYKDSDEVINYFFMIEYPTKVSIGNQIPETCEVHVHIVLGTTLTDQTIKNFIEDTFPKLKGTDKIYIKDITKRDDKQNFVNYLTKQRNYITIDSYNFKIKI
jgi:hypothetical protein